jgi:hypothetical protein
MLPHHARIAAAYEADARDIKRERLAMAIRTVGWCWAWVLAGAGLMGEALHINASVGPFYYPGLMARAQLFFAGGFFIGTAGPLATLLMAWRKAVSRGLIEGS